MLHTLKQLLPVSASPQRLAHRECLCRKHVRSCEICGRLHIQHAKGDSCGRYRSHTKDDTDFDSEATYTAYWNDEKNRNSSYFIVQILRLAGKLSFISYT